MESCGCRCGYKPRRKCCNRRCVGTFTNTYKMYETCCYDMVKVCSCCGHEYDHRRHSICPKCGMEMDDPAGDPPRFGGFGRFGGFRRFGVPFRRFGFPFRRRRFFPGFFPFGFSPDFEEEEEEEDFF